MLFIFLSTFLLILSVHSSFIDVTDKIGIARIDGILVAFGDFNGDKQTDLFVVTNKGRRLVIFLWEGNDQKFKESRANIQLQNSSEKIVNVAPGDYDGDGCLDVVVTTELLGPRGHQHSNPKKVYIFWGSQEEFSAFSSNNSIIGDDFTDQPVVVDVNGDFLPDLFGTKYDKNNKTLQTRTYWISKGNSRRFEAIEQIANVSLPGSGHVKLDPVRVPHSNAFLDFTGDMTADFIVTSQKAQEYGFEVWENKDGSLVFNPEIIHLDPGVNVKHIGQSSFGDINADGNMDMLLPVCVDEYCQQSEVYLYANGKWSMILSNDKHLWKFIGLTNNGSIPDVPLMNLRVGDYNMDGYPDCLTIVNLNTAKGAVKRVAILLENVECEDHENGKDCAEGRTFKVQWKVWSSLEGAVVATFIDLFEDGITDFMIVTESSKNPGEYHMHAIRNDIFLDASFLKVAVLGGSLATSCSLTKKVPYGVNQAGPFIVYTTTDTNGKTKQGAAAQLSQSGYFALQCPYTVFGLGRTPNFVDKLTIGMPKAKNSPMRTRSWPSIIPNSQMIVIPYPPDSPNKWKSKLLVTPSKLVLLTGLAMLGICAFIGLIILALHLKEKRADQKEKRQDAHKFHFDAM